MLDLSSLNFEKGSGLVTVVTQDAVTGAVLTVAHADREALERTIATGEMHYRSRTRGLWHKGATSGHTQRVVSLTADCDGDAVLARVDPRGPACHTGQVSCFGDRGVAADALGELDATIAHRKSPLSTRNVGLRGTGAYPSFDVITPTPTSSPMFRPKSESPAAGEPPRVSYTQKLLDDRNLRLKKLGEEAAELVTACADGDADRAVEESVDLIYHLLVNLHSLGATLDEVRREVAKRAGTSNGSEPITGPFRKKGK
jgi:phosphoribosyl-AMP cyclohydrolase / phosphoribosyl-ATP pyrophosphohydrolase